MIGSANPFPFGRVLEREELVGRAAELELLVTRLTGGGRHFLIGPRRFGKTSLLGVAAEEATARGTPTVMVNAESFTSLDALAAGIVSEASKLIAPNLKERMQGVARWFSAIKPQVEYDPMTDALKVSVAPNLDAPKAQTLVDALNGLDALAASRDQRIGIVIDEFQVVHEFDGLPGERALRAAVQQHRYLSYVFAGSHTRMLLAMVSEHNRPFYRLGDSQFLGAVPRPAFAEYIRTVFAQRDQLLTEAAMTHLFDTCEDVPYNVQRLAAELWDRRASDASPIDVDIVLDALREINRRAHANHLALYLTLTPTQRKVLAGMAGLANLNDQVSRSCRAIGVAASTYRAARKSFLSSDILHERFGVDQTERRYAFVDPFFKMWLRGFVVG